MNKANLTVGAFSVPFAEGFIDKDNQIVPKLKSLKRFAAILADYGPFNLKFILPEEGQLGVLTETGYQDGVLGLVQDEKVDVCFLPLSLDTQKAPGYFTSVISEENYYILTCRNLNDLTSAIITSLTSVETIPLLLAVLSILMLELIAVKHFEIDALLTAIFRSFGISFYQNLPNHSLRLFFIQMIILMFPVFILNSAFSTQTIVGTADAKVDTLKDIIRQGKIPYYIEGISMYDFFKGKVTAEYADIFERSVSAGLDEPFPLGPIAGFDRLDKMVTFVSGVGRKLAPLAAVASNVIKPNQEQYFSSKPFHRSLQAFLFSYNTSKSLRKRFDTMARWIIQSGMAEKIEEDIYIEFILSFYPLTLYDFHKSEALRKGDDLNWQPLNYIGFKQVFYLLIMILILSTVVLSFELIIVFLAHSQRN